MSSATDRPGPGFAIAALKLCRVSNLPTVWTNVLAAQVLTGAPFAGAAFLLLALLFSLLYAGGMCQNDLFDLERDRTGKPFRPLPAGELTPGEAGALARLLLTAGLLLLLAAPHPEAVLPGLLLLLSIWGYNRVHRVHRAGALLMANCRLLIFITTSLAVTGRLELAAAAAGAVQFTAILGISLLARRENLPPGLMPLLLAAISLVDGVLMAFGRSPLLFLAGIAGAGLTLAGQRLVRGD